MWVHLGFLSSLYERDCLPWSMMVYIMVIQSTLLQYPAGIFISAMHQAICSTSSYFPDVMALSSLQNETRRCQHHPFHVTVPTMIISSLACQDNKYCTIAQPHVSISDGKKQKDILCMLNLLHIITGNKKGQNLD